MSWSTRNFRNILDKYMQLYLNEKDPAIKERYLRYISNIRYEIVMEELSLVDNKQDTKEEMNVNINKEDVTLDLDSRPCFGVITRNIFDVSKNDMYFPFVEEFKNKLDKLLEVRDFKFNNESNLILSDDDIVEIIHDMFKDTTKEIYDLYLRFENRRDEFLSFNPVMKANDGASFAFPVVDESYAVVGTDGAREDTLITLTHELGHIIGSMLNMDRYADDEKLVEIESTFFELIGLDYLSGQFSKDFFIDYMKNKVFDNFKDSKNIIAMRDVSMEFFDNLINVKEPYDYFKCLSDNNFDYKEIDLPEKVKYLIGYITAIELFEVYKEDKELAVDVLKKIVCADKNKTEYQRLNDNIELNKNLDKHVKRLAL